MTSCPRCGSPLPAPGAACPRCLLALGLAGEADPPPPVSPTDPTLSLAAAPTYELPPEAERGRSAPSVPRFAAGRTLGPYRLLRPLGAGGFGEVWEAEDERDQRHVALKLLTEDLSPTARERFRREGRIAASIHHPRVVFLFSAEELAGVPALAMELLPGGTLKDLVERSGPLPWRDAVARILELVDGLEAAQSKGILHRDIKPSNCFLDERGEVKIGDFGLSRPTDGGDDYTKTGTYVGTPAYSSPEQIKGAKLDLRSDLFSLGATLYYLLTGRAPFEGETLGQVMAKVLAEEPPPVGAELPRGLDRALSSLLAKAPERRPSSYGALRVALLPYSESRLSPGDLFRRAAAFTVDLGLLAFVLDPTVRWAVAAAGVTPPSESTTVALGPAFVAALWPISLELLYFFALELRFGASPGKLLFGLCVRRTDGSAMGAARALIRTTVFVLLAQLIWEISDALPTPFWHSPYDGNELREAAVFVADLTALLVASYGLLAITMRRANGYAGLHELVSGTRVVRLRRIAPSRIETSSVPEPADRWPLERAAVERLGPFDVLGEMTLDRGQRMLVGVDPQLDRRVWLFARSDGPLAAHDLRRLQTVSGGDDGWEVFAAPRGGALVDRRRGGRTVGWREERAHLHAVATLLARRDPAERRALATFWVDESGDVLLLPLAVPRGLAGASPSAREPLSIPLLLHQAMLFLVEGEVVPPGGLTPGRMPARPIPRAERTTLELIARQQERRLPEIAEALSDRLDVPGEATRRARVASLLPWIVPSVVLGMTAFSGELDFTSSDGLIEFASGFGAFLLFFLGALALSALPLAVLLPEGGLGLRLAQLAVVASDGRPAGPLRRLLRALLSVGPWLAAISLAQWQAAYEVHGIETEFQIGLMIFGRSFFQALGLAAIAALGALFAVLSPARGLQDRIAGTALVPR